MKRKRGRPRKEPTTTISFRGEIELIKFIKTNKAEIKELYGISANQIVLCCLMEIRNKVIESHGN